MRDLDLTSVLVAAFIGAALLSLYYRCKAKKWSRRVALVGAFVGVGVQLGERLTGAS